MTQSKLFKNFFEIRINARELKQGLVCKMLFVSYDWKIKKKCRYWIAFVSLLGELSKTSDHISLDLIIIKLEVYRFNLDVSKLFVNYLPNKKDGL